MRDPVPTAELASELELLLERTEGRRLVSVTAEVDIGDPSAARIESLSSRLSSQRIPVHPNASASFNQSGLSPSSTEE